jgi:GxxExxY protein
MARDELIHERLTYSVIGAFFEVYNTLGFGLLEHLYVAALELELRERGHRVAREVWVPVYYKGILIGRQRLDMVVDEALVVETKSTRKLPAVARRQIYNYLCVTRFRVGLLLHFGPVAKHYRINGRRSDPPSRAPQPSV